MVNKKITIKDIARVANVSTAAVSMAINKLPGVSDATRKRILKVARELEYQPDYIAKSMITKRNYTIGLILDDIANPFFPELAKGIEVKAAELDYGLLVCNTSQDLKAEKKCIDMLRSRGVDGIIITTVTADDANIKPLIEDQFPFVCVIRQPLDPFFDNKVDYVAIDNFSGGYKGIKHLWRLGHDRIAILTGPLNASTVIRRIEGIKAALAEQGVKLNQKLLVECNFTREKGYLAAKRLLKWKKPPTAFFSFDATMAIGVRDAVLESGLRIPEDIALMGCDDIEMVGLPGIEITTLSQKKYEIGNTGVKVLMDKIEKKDTQIVNKIVLKAEMIIRKSCGYHLHGYKR